MLIAIEIGHTMARKPRQQRAKATVDAIVEAGFIAMADRGPAGTTTRQIADIAGVGVGSLYEYFENKEDIFTAMSQRFVTDTIAMIQPQIPIIVRKPIREAVMELLSLFRDFLQADEARYLKCARYAMALDFEQYVEPLQKTLSELVTQYLMHHPETLRIRNIPTMSYIMIHGGIYSVVRQLCDPTPPISFDELAAGLADMVGHYIEREMALAGHDIPAS
ncbi:MAG: TetR/AcrR family transcriptional regulator [Gammaproteobacteria bacterium]|uniref:Transcriptional regulator, TetR family n=1 Tax=Marinobacter nitratireducens TaxID=1137280 RepID=A0A072NCN0_9GAMM|nr:TetR/AcrR family transcriptional regulator [Marinobacter nitratireducens]KEF30860.1 Transcriptional regulator, TetR family [Marinobacter nitratireducens]TNE73422.1 MAG: TetR/AcrR family transcriptional regulator [Gammaproteobacteria bacterium]